MKEIMQESLFFGVALSVGTFILGLSLKKRVNIFLFNPLLVSIVCTIAVLLITGISYEN